MGGGMSRGIRFGARTLLVAILTVAMAHTIGSHSEETLLKF